MSTGAPGSGTRISFLYFLEAFGLSLQDIKSHPLAFNEAAEALKDGNIELFYSAGGIPVAGVSSVSQAIDAVILEFTQDDIKRLQKICSAMYGFVVPAKSYRGQEKDVLTAAYGAMLIARSDLNPQLVYNVIKALYENQDELARIHPTGKELNIQRAFVGADYSYSLGVKHHPGVVKYLKEEQKWDKKYD